MTWGRPMTLTERDRADTDVRREATTMALYVAILLLAALAATSGRLDGAHLLALIWGSTLGVAVTHWFSFTVAARLLTHEETHVAPARLLRGQMLAAGAVAAAASTATLFLPDDAEHRGAVLVTACSIGAVVYVQSRWAGATTSRSVGVAVVALVAGMVVAVVKVVLTH